MIVAPNATDVSTYFKLVDPASGVPETGLTITDLDATYVRDRATAVKSDLTALGAVDAAHSDNQAIEVSAANAPGLYRVDWPDAAFAAGVARVQLIVNGAAIDPAVIEVELLPFLTPVTGATVLPNTQEVRDAMKLAPTAGAPAGGSVDAQIDTIETNVGTAIALDGGVASLAGMLTKVADNNGGADFIAANDSLHEVAVDAHDAALRLGTSMVVDGGVYKFTANALEEATAPIADAVWDELIAGHLGAGSTGAALNALAPAGATVLNAEITEIHVS